MTERSVDATASYPFAVNVRLADRHASFIRELQQQGDLGQSAAVREAIDVAIAAKKGAGVVNVQTVTGVSFTGVPELDHVELAIASADDEGRRYRQEMNLDLELAHELLEQLHSAIDALEVPER